MKKDEKEFRDKMIDSYSKVHNERYWNEITPWISELAQGTVLDIGCGPGLLLKDIQERFNSNKLIGIDLSDVMLAKAEDELIKNQHQSKVELINQHMQENPVLPNNLDLVVSSRVLRSFENIAEVLQSIHSSLQDNGRLVILDWGQASIYTYASWFNQESNTFDEDMELGEIIRYHRNFSRYSLLDWDYMISKSGFQVNHAFHLNEVQLCIIATKEK